MKNIKEFILEGSRNNGQKIAKDIIKAYFGGYVPKKLSDEGMECDTDDDIYKLIEKMELYYISQPDCEDPYDESDIDTIHNELTNWIRKHNN